MEKYTQDKTARKQDARMGTVMTGENVNEGRIFTVEAGGIFAAD